MKLRLCKSGGIANLRIEEVIDTSKLSHSLAESVEQLLEPEKLEVLSERQQAVGAADMIYYEIEFLEASPSRTFLLSEADISDDLNEVLEQLVKQVIDTLRDKRRSRGT